jgi:gas vesicle protein
MNGNAKTLLGIVAAGAVGVAVGMLLAPEKGSDLRKSIKGSIDDLGEKLLGFVGEGKEFVSEVSDDIKEQARGLKNDVKNDVRSRIDNAKQSLS